jgi:hypothetical protein
MGRMALLDTLAPMEIDEHPLDLKQAGRIYEIKFDGYRLMAEFGDVSLTHAQGRRRDD